MERVRAESKSHGTTFRETLNELIRVGLVTRASLPARAAFKIKPVHMGYYPDLNYDSTEALLEYGEGVDHR